MVEIFEPDIYRLYGAYGRVGTKSALALKAALRVLGASIWNLWVVIGLQTLL